jgi:hypothetical protein
LKSVFLNGLECTRLPWDILGSNGAPECQGTSWGVSPEAGGLVPPWATSATSGDTSVTNASNSSKASSGQLEGPGMVDPSNSRSSSSSGLTSGTLLSPGVSPGTVTTSDADRAVKELLSRSPWSALGSWHDFDPAAAAQMMTCMSHYCCGLQVIETLGVVTIPPGGNGGREGDRPGTNSSSDDGEEPKVSAADGPSNGTKEPQMVRWQRGGEFLEPSKLVTVPYRRAHERVTRGEH